MILNGEDVGLILTLLDQRAVTVRAVPNVDLPFYIEIGLFSPGAEHTGGYVFSARVGTDIYMFIWKRGYYNCRP